jgi:GMP synthase (glutamine-hydrolysing)
MTGKIAVVDASVGETPAERNIRRELDADVDVYKVSEGVFPPVPTARDWRYDGVVISGSQTSVYDDHDWIHEATEWIRRVHRADVPVLGICWGHQFLAQALGGRVVDMDQYEIGYRRIDRVGEDPLFEGVPAAFTSFETHSDRVAELPPGAATLARNEVGLQAFRVGVTYGVQFHPEYDRETAEWVIQNKEFPAGRTDALLEAVTEETVAAATEAKRVFENFVDIAASHQPVVRGSVRSRPR